MSFPKVGTGPFWILVGIGILAVLLATSWRIAKGAELEATGKEWSLKVKEAADKLDEGRKQLEAENSRLKAEATGRDAKWAEAIKALQDSCPKAKAKTPAPPDPVAKSAGVSEEALKDIEKSARVAREVAESIRVPKLLF